MIFVNRKRIPVPAVFRSETFRTLVRDQQVFFARSKQSRLQERFEYPWSDPNLKELREALFTLFYEKCAYCETSLITASRGDIDHFRPQSAPSGLLSRNIAKALPTNWITIGDEDRDPYWWLALKWENFYLACETCRRHKGNKFPVVGRRAPFGATGTALRKEAALLLDPCSDQPEKYLSFDESGIVAGRDTPDKERFYGLNRGQITIDVLALNRPELVNDRKQAAAELRRSWDELIVAGDRKAIPGELHVMLHAARRYAGMCRQLVARWRYESPMVLHKLPAAARKILQESLPAPAETLMRDDSPEERRPSIKRRKLTGGLQTIGFVKSVRIRNFRAIRDLLLEIPIGTNDRMGWKVLLGENGTGKSTILQAIAFGLMGPSFVHSHLDAFHLKPSDLLRRVRGHRRAASALIEIAFSTGAKSVMQVSANGVEWVEEPPSGMFVRGFGATRLLPRKNSDIIFPNKGQLAKVTNLFDPITPVFDAIRWLAGLKDRKQFGSAALSLKDLLHLPTSAHLRVNSGRVEVPIDGLKHPLDELSSGYESVLVIAADIIAGNLGRLQDFSRAPGIVLLDEIDAHLHPRWRMRIVESLRRCFPNMQFIVTTHDPLCLRGVEENEATVLERFGSNVAMLTDLPNPSSMRVDQLLTSNFFGLGSTIDPVIEREFERYYTLLASPNKKLTPAEKSERDQLREKLAKYEYRLMADTPREELLLEVLDEYVAEDALARGKGRESLPALRVKAKARVKAFWQDLDRSGGRAV